MKKSNDTIGNRNRDHPACSAVPEPTAPPRAAIVIGTLNNPACSAHALYYVVMCVLSGGTIFFQIIS